MVINIPLEDLTDRNEIVTMTLTRQALVNRISDETGFEKKQMYDVLRKILAYITEALAKGDKVELRQFGVFEVKVHMPRIGRNPQKPKRDIVIPARLVVKFRSGKEMRAQVSKIKVEKKSKPDL
jgi:nucleoid DNA-binding protein